VVQKFTNTINVELANDAVLYQNIPNPFGEETMINYYIPENTGNAKIIFFDMYGQNMKEVPLTETGSGNIHVDWAKANVVHAKIKNKIIDAPFCFCRRIANTASPKKCGGVKI
jgi:hypothetical protein